MQIDLRDDDRWLRIADDETLPPAGDLVVSQQRWLREREALRRRDRGRVAVQLDGGNDVHALAGDLDRLPRIVLEFYPAGDGRGYSQARLLRERLGYRGELCATGKLLPDHLPFLERCGVDRVLLDHGSDLAAARQALTRISVHYQPVDGGEAIARCAEAWRAPDRDHGAIDSVS